MGHHKNSGTPYTPKRKAKDTQSYNTYVNHRRISNNYLKIYQTDTNDRNKKRAIKR